MAIYKGDKEIVGLYKGPTEIIKRYKGSNLIYNVFKWLPYSYEHIYNSLVPQYINKSNIPEEYQEVEYIESTGTQYINIGYAPKFDDNIKITLMPLQTLVDLAFFGVYDGSAQACELGQVGYGFRGNVGEENRYATVSVFRRRCQLLILDDDRYEFTECGSCQLVR